MRKGWGDAAVSHIGLQSTKHTSIMYIHVLVFTIFVAHFFFLARFSQYRGNMFTKHLI